MVYGAVVSDCGHKCKIKIEKNICRGIFKETDLETAGAFYVRTFCISVDCRIL